MNTNTNIIMTTNMNIITTMSMNIITTMSMAITVDAAVDMITKDITMQMKYSTASALKLQRNSQKKKLKKRWKHWKIIKLMDLSSERKVS